MLSVNSLEKLQGFCFLASLSKHDGSSRPVEFFFRKWGRIFLRNYGVVWRLFSCKYLDAKKAETE